MRAGRRRAGELADQVEPPEPRRDAQVAGLEPEQVDDLAVAPEQRRHERRPAVAARRDVGAAARVEHQLREPAVVRVAGLVQLRPAVVVAAIRVGATLQQQPHEVEVARHPEQVVPVRAALPHEVGVRVEQLLERRAVACLDGAVAEHERRRRLLAARHPPDVRGQLVPGREPVPPRQLCPRLVDADAARGRDPVRPPLVVVEVGVERLLDVRRASSVKETSACCSSPPLTSARARCPSPRT